MTVYAIPICIRLWPMNIALRVSRLHYRHYINAWWNYILLTSLLLVFTTSLASPERRPVNGSKLRQHCYIGVMYTIMQTVSLFYRVACTQVNVDRVDSPLFTAEDIKESLVAAIARASSIPRFLCTKTATYSSGC